MNGLGFLQTEYHKVKLSDILTEYYESATKGGRYEHVSLTQAGVVPKTERFNRDFLVTSNNKKYRITHKDDICYNPANLKFHVICRNTYGDAIFSPIYVTFKVNEKYDPAYISYAIMMDSFIASSMKYQEGTVYERMAVSPEDLLTMEINVPNLDAQKRIAKILLGIENKIALEKKEVNKLKILKSSMLVKMFPKEGESAPEIRFNGFTDPWEQRKLSNICSMHARIGWQNLRTSEFLDSGDYCLITGTDFEDGRVNWRTCHYVEQERYEQDRKIQIKNGSILITKDGTLGKVAFVEGLSKPATLNAGVFNVEIIDKEIDNKYLFQYLKAPFLMNYVNKKATGGTIKHLNQNILVDFPAWISNYEEQKLIGTCFLHLDHLITLHQRKCEKLLDTKKALLEKLIGGDN